MSPAQPGQPGEPDQLPGPANQTSGLDGFTEDDVPMMQVGPPSMANPNQVTTKPRQMPAGGAPAPGMFDPAAMGMDVEMQRAEDNDTGTNAEDTAGDEMPGQQFEAMARYAMRSNPNLTQDQVVDLVVEAIGHGWGHVGDGPITQNLSKIPVGKTLDHRPHTDRLKQKVKDRVRPPIDHSKEQAKSWISEQWNRLKAPEQPVQPEQPEGQAEPQEPREPTTVGEYTRDVLQNSTDPRDRLDLWKQRYSQTPIDEDEPDRPFGHVSKVHA